MLDHSNNWAGHAVAIFGLFTLLFLAARFLAKILYTIPYVVLGVLLLGLKFYEAEEEKAQNQLN